MRSIPVMSWDFLLYAVLFIGVPGPATAQLSFTLDPGSRVWINGKSNVNAFTCQAGRVAGGGSVSRSFPSDPTGQGGDAWIGLDLNVPVRSFECGNRQMNGDLYGAMKAASHPAVRFRLSDVRLADDAPDSEGWYRLRALGRLTIAGVERRTEITLQAKRLDADRFRLRGSTMLLMTDFGIEPPTAMLGLIRARNALTVHFDISGQGRAAPYASAR